MSKTPLSCGMYCRNTNVNESGLLEKKKQEDYFLAPGAED